MGRAQGQVSDTPWYMKVNDTVWYNKYGWEVSGMQAIRYRLPSVGTDSGYRTTYYRINGSREMVTYGPRPNVVADSGYYIYYNKQGYKTAEGLQRLGEQVGRWLYYYHGVLQLEATYKYGVRHGASRRYYAGTSKLYREGSYFLGVKDDTFRTYYRNGVLKRVDYYDGGKLIRGTCFDSLGRWVAFTPFMIEPGYPGNLNEVLDSVCRKDRRQGRLPYAYNGFSFTISRDGDISGLALEPAVDTTNNRYISKLFARMRRWTPMIIDGCAVASYAHCRICSWRVGVRMDVVRFEPAEDVTLQLR